MKTETLSSSRRSFIHRLLSVPLALAGAASIGAMPPKPESRFVLLNDFHIAGFRYYDGPRQLPSLSPGTLLSLRAEPGNPHDSFAVEIFCGSAKLGYVPRFCNRHISRMLREQLPLRCEVDALNPSAPPWAAVAVRVSIESPAHT